MAFNRIPFGSAGRLLSAGGTVVARVSMWKLNTARARPITASAAPVPAAILAR